MALKDRIIKAVDVAADVGERLVVAPSRRASRRVGTLSSDDVLRALVKAGWLIDRPTDSQAVLCHPARTGRVTVSLHGAKPLQPVILASILSQAGLTEEELRKLI